MEIISAEQFDTSRQAIVLGKEYSSEVIIDLGSLMPDDIGVELVIADMTMDNEVAIKRTQEFDLENVEGKRATFRLNLVPLEPGVFDTGIRVYAKNKELPHRMDFNLARWI
jgi:hypothetical protein